MKYLILPLLLLLTGCTSSLSKAKQDVARIKHGTIYSYGNLINNFRAEVATALAAARK